MRPECELGFGCMYSSPSARFSALHTFQAFGNSEKPPRNNGLRGALAVALVLGFAMLLARIGIEPTLDQLKVSGKGCQRPGSWRSMCIPKVPGDCT